MAEEPKEEEATGRWHKLKELFRPKGVNDGETGLDRVKSLCRVRYGEPLSEEVKDFPTIVIVATCVGFAFGGMLGARHAGDKFVAMNHHAKFTSTMQAQRELHSAATLGLVRQGCKWGWKVGLFASIFSGVAIILAAYRDKDDSLNYLGAGGITGGIYRLKWGVMPTIGGSVLGLLISLPIGLCNEGLSRILIGTDERKKTRQRLHEARMKREKSWEQKLDATSVLIDDITSEVEVEAGGGLKSYYDVQSVTGVNGDTDSSHLKHSTASSVTAKNESTTQ